MKTVKERKLLNLKSRNIKKRTFISREGKQKVPIVIFTTTRTLSTKYNNTLLSLKYFKEEYGAVPIVFTESTEVVNYCKTIGIVSLNVVKKNKYGFPRFSSLLYAARNYAKRDFYMYINSDILINPQILASLNFLKSSVPTPSLYCGRVIVTSKIPDHVDYRDPSLFPSLHAMKHHLRSILEIDYFIFSRNFPFRKIPPVVVGRWGVDSAIMATAHNQKVSIVDMTHLSSFHQGTDASSKIRATISDENWLWNFKYFKRSLVYETGKLTSNYLVKLV